MIPSNVVRIVNLHEEDNNHSLTSYIQRRVFLAGNIKQMYVRKWKPLNLVFAYVIFESNSDAKETVAALNGSMYVDKKLDVSLIGPREKYNLYDAKQVKSTTQLRFRPNNLVDRKQLNIRLKEARDEKMRRQLDLLRLGTD